MNRPEMEPRRDLVRQTPRPPERAGYIDYGYQTAAPGYPADTEGIGPSLIEYWRILRRRKGIIIMIAFACLLLGILFTLPQTPIYQARAALEIQDVNPEFASLRTQQAASEIGSITNALADVQTQIKILQSETLVEKALDKLKVQNRSDSLAKEATRVSAWRRAFGLGDPEPSSPESEIRQTLENLRARAAGQTRIVEVTYDSPNPKAASDFLNLLTNEFIEQNIDSRWKMMQRTGDWLTRQVDQVRIKLERSEDALQNYARRNGLLFTHTTNKEGQNVTEEKLHQLQAELSKAQADRVSKQSRYEMAKNSPSEALPDVLNDLTLREYQTKLTDLRRQQAEMTATYKPEYGKVRRIEAQIAPLESALERERQAILDRIKNDYQEAQRREKLLLDDYNSQVKLVTNDAEKSIQYNILKREVDTNRQIYEAMLQRVKESSISSAMRASNIRVVDAARPPRRPYKPKLAQNAGLGLVAGIFLGVAFVITRERANRAIQEPGEAPLMLNIPELGIIPSAVGGFRNPVRYVRQAIQSVSAPSESTALQTVPERVELLTWQHKTTVIAEAFRAVLTSLLFSVNNGSRPRILVLTSASPGEGKTTTACNLAIALAEINQRTLLIDADLRRPRVHSIFGLDNEQGLSTALQNRSLAQPDPMRFVHETKVPGLSVIPSGPPTTAAANLLHSPNLDKLIGTYKQTFDMVILDTPPMLQMPDARIAARSADAVVLVIRAGSTTKDAVLAAHERLAADGTKVLGTILNDWNSHNSPNGYYGYYRGYGAYSHDYSRRDG